MRRLLLILLLQTSVLFAQDNLVPAGPQQKAIILLNGTAHLGNGEVIENAAIGFEDGEITLVADARSIRVDTTKADVIDATGQHIYPGLIAPNTTLGLVEIDAVRATRDMDETGAFNPNVRALIAFNTDSDVIPTIRSNGILLAEAAPQGGRIAGTSSLMKLDGWNWEDAVYRKDIGLHLNWPGKYRRKSKYELKEHDNWKESLRELESFFEDARSYCNSSVRDKNLKLEAMCPVLDSMRKVFIHVDKAHDMLHAIAFIKKFNLDGVFVGAEDAWRLTDELHQADIPVVLASPHRLPATTDADIHQPYKTPAILQRDSVMFCLGIRGFGQSWNQRNLPFVAGTAAAYGLSREEALQSITLSTARIFGMDDFTGSLEEGKDANIIVSSGDVLDMNTSVVTRAFIKGRAIDLDNKQKQLYHKYLRKYNLEER